MIQRFFFLSLCCSVARGWVSPKPPLSKTSATVESFVRSTACSSRGNSEPRKRTNALTLRQSGDGFDGGRDEQDRDRDRDEESSLDDRMQVVRSLQACFYKSAHGDLPAQTLDLARGVMHNLPLWRVQWYEVPGRTNVLNVHEGIYTNMFETILHQEPPWYVGHLYLPHGSAMIRAKESQYRLCTWRERVRGQGSDRSRTNGRLGQGHVDDDVEDEHKNDTDDDESAVVGTLLRITDYRRMMDGRLLLLVQAMERFVVTDVQQQLPYSVAHVQIIPDTEEIEESNWRRNMAEQDVSAARALAIQESFERWHRYEHENTLLPLPMENNLNPSEVLGSALAKVLPYSPFSSVVKVSNLRHETLEDPRQAQDDNTEFDEKHFVLQAERETCTLEESLVKGQILSDPCLDPALTSLSMDELEERLWLALNDFLKSTRTPVSPILLGLLPKNRRWPSDFLLERIARFVQLQTKLEHKYVRVSADYPSLRRQKRLSYSAAALLESPDSVNVWRRQLLAIPSTKDRLAFVLQKFETEYGAFQ